MRYRWKLLIILLVVAIIPHIRPGQIYAFGTDGLWETLNIKGGLFGKERLREIVRAQAGKSAKDIKKAILKAVKSFRGSREQEDDITLVIVKAGFKPNF